MKELDSQISEEDLDGIIEEVDADGSGTVDFDGEFYTLEILLNYSKYKTIPIMKAYYYFIWNILIIN